MLSLLLIASTTGFGTSPLVEPDHQHNWMTLEQSAVDQMWWDENSVGTREIDGTVFPIVLLRAKYSKSDLPFQQLDTWVAVNCETKQIAGIEVFIDGPKVGPKRRAVDTLDFTSLPAPKSEKTAVLMKTLCGGDWTP